MLTWAWLGPNLLLPHKAARKLLGRRLIRSSAASTPGMCSDHASCKASLSMHAMPRLGHHTLLLGLEHLS